MRRIALVATIALLTACGTLLGAGGDDATDPPTAPSNDAASATQDAPSGDDSSVLVDPGADAGDAEADAPRPPDPPCIGGNCDRWIFVTGATFDGLQVGGIAGADAKCQTAGDAFKPGRTFRALLSDGISTVSGRFTPPTQARYFTGNNLLVAESFTDLMATMHMKRIFDDAAQPPNSDLVWTNTDSAGNAVADDCFGWNSRTGDGVFGNPSATDETWLNNGKLACTQQAHLYCVEQ